MTQTPPKLPRFVVYCYGNLDHVWRLQSKIGPHAKIYVESVVLYRTKRAADRAGRAFLTKLVREGWE